MGPARHCSTAGLLIGAAAAEAQTAVGPDPKVNVSAKLNNSVGGSCTVVPIEQNAVLTALSAMAIPSPSRVPPPTEPRFPPWNPRSPAPPVRGFFMSTSIARMPVTRLLRRTSRRYGNFVGTRLKLYGLAAQRRAVKAVRVAREDWQHERSTPPCCNCRSLCL